MLQFCCLVWIQVGSGSHCFDCSQMFEDDRLHDDSRSFGGIHGVVVEVKHGVPDYWICDLCLKPGTLVVCRLLYHLWTGHGKPDLSHCYPGTEFDSLTLTTLGCCWTERTEQLPSPSRQIPWVNIQWVGTDPINHRSADLYPHTRDVIQIRSTNPQKYPGLKVNVYPAKNEENSKAPAQKNGEVYTLSDCSLQVDIARNQPLSTVLFSL